MYRRQTNILISRSRVKYNNNNNGNKKHFVHENIEFGRIDNRYSLSIRTQLYDI